VGTAASGGQVAFSVEGSSKTTDVLNLSAVGVATLDVDGSGADVIETVNLSGNGGALTVAVSGPTNAANVKINTAGDQDVTVTGTAAFLTGATVTGASTGVNTVKITSAGVLDTSKMSVDNIVTGDNGGNAITVASGQNLEVGVTQTTDFELTAASATKSTNEINITVDDGAATTGTVDLIATKATNIATVNVVANDNVDFGAVTITADGTLNISGAGTAVVADSSTAKAVDGSGMTGALTVTMETTMTKATGGAGKDTFILDGDQNFTIDGGAGSDTLKIVSASTDLDFSNNTTESFTGIDVIQFDDTTSETTHTFSSSLLNEAVLIVKGEAAVAGDNDHLGVAMDETSVDLSGVTIDDKMDDIVVTSTAVASSALTITGSAYADTVTAGSQSDTINLGEGANTVVDAGDGDDVITGGAGVDTVTQAGAGNDTMNLGDGNNVVTDAGAGNDTITTGSGDDTVTTSGAGNDVMNLGDGANTADGNSGDDSITGGKNVDTFTGGDGKDTLNGLAGADVLYGDNAGAKEKGTLTVIGSNSGAIVHGDVFTLTAFGKTVSYTADVSGASGDTLVVVATKLADAMNTAMGDIVTVTQGTSSGSLTAGLTVESKVDGATAFTASFKASAGSVTAITVTEATAGALSAGGVDTINAGDGADLVVAGEGKDVIDLGADSDADVVVVTAAMGGDTITNFAAGDAGADTIKFAADLFNNGTVIATLKSIASNGVIADNDAFVEITTATAAGGADTAAEVAKFLENLDNTAMGNSESVLLAVTDGTDTYLWKYAEGSSRSADVQEAELTLEATLVGVSNIANGDLAFLA